MCVLAVDRRVQIYLDAFSSDPVIAGRLTKDLSTLFVQVDEALPAPTGPEITRYSTPNTGAAIDNGLFAAVVGSRCCGR